MNCFCGRDKLVYAISTQKYSRALQNNVFTTLAIYHLHLNSNLRQVLLFCTPPKYYPVCDIVARSAFNEMPPASLMVTPNQQNDGFMVVFFSELACSYIVVFGISYVTGCLVYWTLSCTLYCALTWEIIDVAGQPDGCSPVHRESSSFGLKMGFNIEGFLVTVVSVVCAILAVGIIVVVVRLVVVLY